MIPGYRVHIARGARARIKISSPDKVEARMDSAGDTGDHKAHIARSAKVQIRTFRAVKAEAGVDTARARIKTSRAGEAEVQADSARASRAEVAELSKAQAQQSKVEAAEVSSVEISPHRAGESMAGGDSFAQEVWAGRARICSRKGSHLEIQTSLCRPEAGVGRQARDEVGGKAWDRAEDRGWGQVGDRVCNLKMHRMPMLHSHRLLKTRQKNRRANNAETLKQYNSSAALPI
jgi:hypothetical protein